MKHGSRGEEFRLSKHAQFQMQRRAISAEEVFQVLNAPEQIHFVGQGRAIYQSRIELHGRLYLLRIVVDIHKRPFKVITVYRTSKIAKYWRVE